MRRKRIIFVDVDDTLVRTFGHKRSPRPAVIDTVRRLAATGQAELYCWSSGGAEYARQSAVEWGIEACFVGFLPKPEAYLDDQAMSEWRDCQHVLPHNSTDRLNSVQP